jgi:hypothetical protein
MHAEEAGAHEPATHSSPVEQSDALVQGQGPFDPPHAGVVSASACVSGLASGAASGLGAGRASGVATASAEASSVGGVVLTVEHP